MLCPLVKIKPVESHALNTDGDFVHEGTDDLVEAIAVHGQVGWGIAQTYESGQDHATLIELNPDRLSHTREIATYSS